MIRKNYFVFILLLCSVISFAQFILPNEEIIFSFETQSGKKAFLNKDKQNKYIIYRFGSKNKVELEFSDKTNNSFKQFTYSFYLRGGGAQNEGMDLNYVYFTNKGYKYVIYDTYYAVGNKKEIGIKVIDLQTNKTQSIKGNLKTCKGNLIDFRYNHLLEIKDEIFD